MTTIIAYWIITGFISSLFVLLIRALKQLDNHEGISFDKRTALIAATILVMGVIGGPVSTFYFIVTS